MLTRSILQRVFYIKTVKGTGTCFSIIINGKELFITADHVMESTQKGDNVYFYIKNEWKAVPIIGILGKEDFLIDVAAFTINPKILSDEIDLSPTVSLGQDCYFLGFPDTWNLKGDVHTCMEINEGIMLYPIPFAKKSIISNIAVKKIKEHKITYFYLDGITNKGFSGGPVVMNSPTNVPRIVGVVSAHTREKADLFKNENGTLKPLEEIAMVQSGISIAYHLPLDKLKQWDGL